MNKEDAAEEVLDKQTEILAEQTGILVAKGAEMARLCKSKASLEDGLRAGIARVERLMPSLDMHVAAVCDGDTGDERALLRVKDANIATLRLKVALLEAENKGAEIAHQNALFTECYETIKRSMGVIEYLTASADIMRRSIADKGAGITGFGAEKTEQYDERVDASLVRLEKSADEIGEYEARALRLDERVTRLKDRIGLLREHMTRRSAKVECADEDVGIKRLNKQLYERDAAIEKLAGELEASNTTVREHKDVIGIQRNQIVDKDAEIERLRLELGARDTDLG